MQRKFARYIFLGYFGFLTNAEEFAVAFLLSKRIRKSLQ